MTRTLTIAAAIAIALSAAAHAEDQFEIQIATSDLQNAENERKKRIQTEASAHQMPTSDLQSALQVAPSTSDANLRTEKTPKN